MLPRWLCYALALSILLLDRITKVLVQQRLSEFDVIPVIPGFFNLVHTENRGAAFGILSDSHDLWRLLLLVGVSAGVMIMLAWMLWRPVKSGLANGWLQLALSLVLGGAAGNLWDRVTAGTVTDFLQFWFGAYEFPSFNVADSAITVGCALLILDLLRPRKKTHAAPADSTR